MVPNLRRLKPKRVMERCCWCNAEIGEDQGVLASGAKMRPDVDLSIYAGSGVYFPMVVAEREIPGLVPTADSEAKKEGKDILFIFCSEKCGLELKKAFSLDITLGRIIDSPPSPKN